jgi:hypothetical protein
MAAYKSVKIINRDSSVYLRKYGASRKLEVSSRIDAGARRRK